jgi:hypothetical protein
VTRDVKQDFQRIAQEINIDGKVSYVQAVARKHEATNTVLMPKDATSKPFL